MSWRAAGLLARGWRRSSRRWWGGTAASLAAVLTLILTVLGTFQGVDHATNERVRDFFTGDLRVTPGRPTAAPSVPFPDAAGTRDALASAAGPGAEVVMRLEAQFILSRRSLLEAYLEESERFGLGAPGTTPEQDFYGIGVIAGLPFQQQAVRASLQPHLVAGTLPGPDAAPDDEVQLVMSLGRYRDYLTPQERERLGDPPDPQALRLARFEVTAAVIDDSGPMRDLLRLPARVVAVYETQLDALDTFTILAPVEDVRRLVGEAPDGAAANAATIHGGDLGAVRALAGRHGWGTEGAPAFAQRYLGEVVGLVRGLALALAVLFLTLPVFLVWHGTSQQLAFHQRELAVARAIGIGPRTVAAALALQAGLTFLAALGMALAAVLLVAASHGRLMQGAGSIPVPVAFHLTASDVALAVAATAAAILLAIAFAMVHHARRDVASDLRAG